jgi:hypothetical protein
MSYVATAKIPRRSVLSAWCPTCQKTQPCSPRQGTTDEQNTLSYTCDICHGTTHEPVLRLSTTLRAEVSSAA